MTRRLSALVVAMGLAIAACGVPVDGEVEEVDLDIDVFDADVVNLPSLCNDTDAQSHPVYFFDENRIVETRRCLARPAFLRTVLNSLLDGPNPEEIDNGVTSAIPFGTEVLGVGVDPERDGVIVVDLNGAFYDELIDELRVQATAQIVFTSFDLLPAVSGVVFQREGVERILPNGNGEQVDRPLTLEDFEVFLEPPDTDIEFFPPPGGV